MQHLETLQQAKHENNVNYLSQRVTWTNYARNVSNSKHNYAMSTTFFFILYMMYRHGYYTFQWYQGNPINSYMKALEKLGFIQEANKYNYEHIYLTCKCVLTDLGEEYIQEIFPNHSQAHHTMKTPKVTFHKSKLVQYHEPMYKYDPLISIVMSLVLAGTLSVFIGLYGMLGLLSGILYYISNKYDILIKKINYEKLTIPQYPNNLRVIYHIHVPLSIPSYVFGLSTLYNGDVNVRVDAEPSHFDCILEKENELGSFARSGCKGLVKYKVGKKYFVYFLSKHHAISRYRYDQYNYIPTMLDHSMFVDYPYM